MHRRWVIAVLGLVAVLAAAPAGRAATASLVADINSRPVHDDLGRPGELLRLGQKVVFLYGSRPWVSDGTGPGTFILRDPCPDVEADCRTSLLGTRGGLAYFNAGERLWRTDGTTAGTLALGPAIPDAEYDSGTFAFSTRGLFFESYTEESGAELWKTDGTPAGTRRVADIEPGLASSGPTLLTGAGNLVYFVTRLSPQVGLWRSDGTAAGTIQLATFGFSDTPRLLTGTAGGRLFYVAGDPEEEGTELWTSDGTVAGTRRLTSFAAPDPFGVTTFLEVIGGAVYFLADDVTGGTDLLTSDGTPGGTHRVTDFGYAQPFPNSSFTYTPAQLEKLGSKMVFVATDGLTGLRLWTSAGSPASTAPVAGGPAVQAETQLVRLGERVLFTRSEPGRSAELWASDTTQGGTRRLRALCPLPCGRLTDAVTVLGGKAYFLAGFGEDLALWATDGTPGGTRRIAPVEGRGPESHQPFSLAVAGGKVVFPIATGRTAELWASDGTAEGTGFVAPLARSESSSWPTDITPLGDGVLFHASDGFSEALWHSDGTGEGTAALPQTGLGGTGYHLAKSVSLGDVAFTVTLLDWYYDPPQLWRTDGTAAGTWTVGGLGDGRIIDMAVLGGKLLLAREQGFWTSAGNTHSAAELFELPAGAHTPRQLAVRGAEMFFVATESGDSGTPQLWVTNGTLAGTRRLTDFEFQPFYDDPTPVRLASGVYFVSSNRGYSRELYRSSAPGAAAPVFPNTGQGPTNIVGLRELGGSLVFLSAFADGSPLVGLWRSDGTAAGTVLLKQFAPLRTPLEAEPFAFGAELFFMADDGVLGFELWKTDGTAAGTVLVRDLAPGPQSSYPSGFAVAGGRLWFAANDGVHGNELWQSDGTAAGTRMAQDIAPGGSSSRPLELTAAAAGRLFFSADDGDRGREPWALPLGDAPACQPSDEALCLSGGRFRVEARWRDFQGNSGRGHAVGLTGDTGYFWFFNPANVEVILKVLDAREVNDHFWAFYGALSNVEYTLTVTDTHTGAARRYWNPAGRFGSVGDTVAFGPSGATGSGLTVGPQAVAAAAEVRAAARPASAEPCVPGPRRLCLNGGRFAVEASWRDFQGNTGKGTAVALTPDTGYFWFFNAANVEVVLKVLDARALNGKFWVFYGALSSVEYTLTVTDTVTGESREYRNKAGRIASAGDTGAF